MTTRERVPIPIRISRELLERLDRAAEVRVVGRNLLVELALERLLAELPPMPAVVATPAPIEHAIGSRIPRPAPWEAWL